jgi:PAS domain S-box-containing protein
MRRKDGSEIWVEDHGRYVHDAQGRITYHEGLLRDVTERKLLQEKLQEHTLNLEKLVEERTRKQAESERRFRDFADLLPQSAFETDVNGNVTFMNQAAFTSTGYSADDLESGLNALQLIVHEQHNDLERNIKQLMNGEDLPPHEYNIRRKDGSTYPVMLESGPIVRDGKTVGIRGVAWNITEEKRMHNELRAATERLEYTIRSNPAAIYSGKPLPDYSDWYLTYISDRITSILGFEPQQYLDLDFWKSHVHPDDRTFTQVRMARILKDGMGSTDYRFLHRDGAYRWIREEAKVDYDAAHRPVEVYGYLTDITELKRSEQATRESEARYRRLFESAPISLWEEDFSEVKQYFDSLRKNGIKDLRKHLTEHPEELTKCVRMVKIIDVNDATLRLYGAKSVKELRGELYRIVTKEFQDQFREEILTLWEGKRRFASEFDNKTLTGETKHVDLILHVIPGYEDTLAKVSVSIIDLTDRLKMEQRLQQAERLAAVGETAAMVGHDLRNPLQGIASAVHLLKQASLTEKERDEMLRVIEKSLDYSDSIVRDLTDYSSRIQLQLGEATPKSIITDVIGSVKTPQSLIVQDLTQNAPTLRVDVDRLRRVFINLLVNAIDAMPQGGTVTFTSQESDGHVEIAVADTGSGMPEKVMENPWRPLQTTKAKGMGLGLAICKRIVDAHQGNISVKSRDHEGTTVTIRLPIEDGTSKMKKK